MDEILYCLWLVLKKGLSPAARSALLSEFESFEGIYRAEKRDLMLCLDLIARKRIPTDEMLKRLENKDLSAAQKEFDRCRAAGIKMLPLSADEYPAPLKNIADPPTLLFCRGDISLLKSPMIGIVGTRRASPYGRWAAAEIAKKAADAGAVVVSGMAYGIDSCAHAGCLAAKGKTVAVLGTGVDVCYPRSNEKLYAQIAESGLIISEFLPGTDGLPANFPERNRIISGLSSKLVVVEGALKSGSMITAALAAEQGREVLAVPGNINQPASIGVNRLIADGATPITDIDEVAGLLGLEAAGVKRRLEHMSESEQLVYLLLYENPGINSEMLALKTCSSIAQTRTLLTAMELKGLIRADGNSLYAQ